MEVGRAIGQMKSGKRSGSRQLVSEEDGWGPWDGDGWDIGTDGLGVKYSYTNIQEEWECGSDQAIKL